MSINISPCSSTSAMGTRHPTIIYRVAAPTKIRAHAQQDGWGAHLSTLVTRTLDTAVAV
jgi:hypothetical protein